MLVSQTASVVRKCAAEGDSIAAELFELIRCPYDHSNLERVGRDRLRCASGHVFPVIQAVPVLLRPEQRFTLWVAKASWDLANAWVDGRDQKDRWFVGTLGLSEEERVALSRKLRDPNQDNIDPVIGYMMGATAGNLFKKVGLTLTTVPLPIFPMEPSPGRLLDIGCNWGRWTIAAAKAGFPSVGIDPSLGAVLAAQRLARRLGADCEFVCGDGRFLPLGTRSFSRVFSYSVVQHLSEPDACACLNEIYRVLEPGGISLVQMPNAFGVRSFYHLIRRRFRKPANFDVCYWRPRKLIRVFKKAIGPSTLLIDGFFGLGVTSCELGKLPLKAKCVLLSSQLLKRSAKILPFLKHFADSLYVRSILVSESNIEKPTPQQQ